MSDSVKIFCRYKCGKLANISDEEGDDKQEKLVFNTVQRIKMESKLKCRKIDSYRY